ncbi:hypothetical protein B0A48_00132 [Cryoendolithus antarcticus]|uniref:Micro-fibrillar-associated protein 1 C-terminal domain-containing protein n=1 Tax=Cryoendolithus antarcticus TaxID=1507870 RepID=A0A1V8TTR1_9PEZI|nr:hypothetical protein B0A48_00132 [Cryoendolithus antarcticus]
MPPPSSRMTKNRVKDFRYRPGKAEVEDEESEYESEEDAEQKEEANAAPSPKASTFPSQKKLAIDLSKADQQRTVTLPTPGQGDVEDLEGFVTASESESEGEAGSGSSEGEDESSEEEDSSSDGEPKRPMLAPKFLSKAQRARQETAQLKTAEQIAAEDEDRRLEKANEALRIQLALDATARAAGKKAWDDDDNIEDEVDDTDDLDPEAERAAWKLRELTRVRRDRLAIEEKEKEREETERRRNLSLEDREAEDKVYIAAQQEEREGKGQMAYMQKYHHKGAFFKGEGEEDEEIREVMNRDLAGARYADETSSKDVLPEYMRIRDMSKLGKKGRTKYKDLKSEDTGRWGDEGRKRGFAGDARFQPDGGEERSGANDVPVGERRRKDEPDVKRARYA